MAYENINVDALIDDINSLLGDEEPAPVPEEPPVKAPVKKPEPQPEAPKKAKKQKKAKKNNGKRPFWKRLLSFLGGFFLVLLETVLLVAVALYGVMFVLIEGPSPTARDLFVRSVRETSAIGFLANIYLSDEEIDVIMSGGVQEPADYQETDTSLIQIPVATTAPDGEEEQGPKPDAWGLVDEDGDGLIIEEVKGEGYMGIMMVVLDPSRVIMGSDPGAYGSHGYTVANMVKRYDGIAGINAGGFEDLNGQGNGSEPNTLVVYEGKTYYGGKGIQDGFVGIDENNILHVATKISTSQIQEKKIRYGVCFGPVLVSNGEICDFSHLISGVNPRTAIGQRSDGAMLLLVIDGRQVSSLGATYADLAEIFLSYGAVNACNLDGGSSTIMYYNGEYINNCASVVGIRPVPTTFVVLKEGGNGNG